MDQELHRDSAYLRIRALILAGEIRSDRPLSERLLAEQLGLGRTPVREALKVLAREGLIEVVPQRGSFLRRPSLDELREIYEVRRALEGMAAYIAAERGPSDELAAVGAELRALAAPERARELYAMDRVGWQFHDALVRSAGNRRLVELYEALRLPIVALRSDRPVDAGRVRTSLVEHLAILDAVLAGDALQAQRLITRHLTDVFSARASLAPFEVEEPEPPRPAPVAGRTDAEEDGAANEQPEGM